MPFSNFNASNFDIEASHVDGAATDVNNAAVAVAALRATEDGPIANLRDAGSALVAYLVGGGTDQAQIQSLIAAVKAADDALESILTQMTGLLAALATAQAAFETARTALVNDVQSWV